MISAAEISVVMGVYNSADSLRETIDSVLSQEGLNLEFIIVDDGSTDATNKILVEYRAQDPRVHIISQENQGLTKALIVGCARARGKYIARQDVGDTSMPGRLAHQRNLLDIVPEAVMVSCGTQFWTPAGEPVYAVSQKDDMLQHGLTQLSLDKVRGPSHHGSTMFRRDAYERTGGYRQEFAVAQDLDLWMRLAEFGRCLAIPDLLYQAKLSSNSISARRRDEQIRTAKTILECAAARRAGRDESLVLKQWNKCGRTISSCAPGPASALDNAKFYYFVASLFLEKKPTFARRYYQKSISYSILYLPAWLRLLQILVRK